MPTRGALTARRHLREPRRHGGRRWKRKGSLAAGARRRRRRRRWRRGGAGGRGGWSVRRWIHRGGAIGSEARGTRSHTGRIRPHQSILRVQGHRPTNYPGLIDARRRRKKPAGLPRPDSLPVARLPALFAYSSQSRHKKGENDRDRISEDYIMFRCTDESVEGLHKISKQLFYATKRKRKVQLLGVVAAHFEF